MAIYRFTKDDITVQKDNGCITLSIVLDGQYIERKYIFYSERAAIKRFQQDFGNYPKDFKPIALCNFGGLAIMEIKDDEVYVCENYGDEYKRLTKNRIFYNRSGYPYFNRNRQRFYLSEFMRVA